MIVGEETMGVAHVLQKYQINDHISIKVPIAIPLHPKTHASWADTGVIPDLPSAECLSLDEAHKLAKQYLSNF